LGLLSASRLLPLINRNLFRHSPHSELASAAVARPNPKSTTQTQKTYGRRRQTPQTSAENAEVKVKINGAGKFLALTLDPEFLKEDAKLVADTLLVAIQDAAKQAKEFNDAEMQKVTSAFQMPGMF
jgi:DNA-binding protein YbaB